MATGNNNGIVAEKVSFQCFLILCCIIILLLLDCSDGQGDILAQGQKLTNGSQLISATGIFTLGFHSPSRLNTNYIGIWYNMGYNKQPVWIGNRNSPFPNNAGSLSLTIDNNGSLKIIQKGNSFSLFEVEEPTNSSAILQDSGNFVLHELNPDGSIKRQLWQSFDHPTDTLLPGMKVGINHKTGSTWSLTSGINEYSPKSGAFTLAMNPNNTNQLLILLRGVIFWSSGNWQAGRFEFSEELSSINNENFNFNRFSNENETYFNYSTSNFRRSSFYTSLDVLPQLRLDYDGDLMWSNAYSEVDCPFFGNMGSNFYFTPADGCMWAKQHKIPECRNLQDHLYFNPRYGYMEGNGSKYKESENLTMYECQNFCISNCDCIAYGSTTEDAAGCEIWTAGTKFRSAVDEGAREIWFFDRPNRKGIKFWLWIIVGLIGAAILFVSCFIFYVKRKVQILKVIGKITRKKDSEQREFLREMGVRSKSFNILRWNRQRREEKKNSELPFFSFETIATATNNFANERMLGKGGFGPVYKGSLGDGQEVAIKRLSKNSGQGLVEFKNEIILIAKLQHTNLVRLIGCCIYKEEKLLVYEYMPNKSLDSFLFDLEKLSLDWDKRLHIIQGIIQGLLYLHNYSRLRIIHRDLKVSNILLDDEMNAKISDFGMARIFKAAEQEANTSRVVGTYGYISPEYAMEGIFSVKSDVYSFGVLLLEIISSRKNYHNYDPERPLNLIGYAWDQLWVNGRGEELIDSGLCNSDDQKAKALRCIHVSLLCVQQIPADRPTMVDVYFMIHNDSTQLSLPKQPAFFIPQTPLSSEVEATTTTTDSGLRSESNWKLVPPIRCQFQ